MRAAPVIVSSAVLALVAVGVGVAVAQPGDDAVAVGGVSVGDVTVDDGAGAGATASDDPSDGPTGSPTDGPTDSPTDAASPSTQQVEGLDTVQGVLTRDDDSSGSDDSGSGSDDSGSGSDDDSKGSDDSGSSDDRDEFEVAGVDLELGPESWLLTAGPVADFDGDGTLRPVLEELEGLVGSEVTVLGRLDDDGDELEVYVIQDLELRSTSGPAPWETGDQGDALDRDAVVEAALDAVGADSRLDSVDREDDGGAAWEVEVVDAQGREQRVLVAADGTVLDIRPED
jgi:uncharacterized membrane protein YkoI